MTKHEHLTNERLRNVFDNQFELVNYAIKLAEYFIKSGKEPFAYQTNQNLATKILRIVESGKGRFRDLPDEKAFIDEIETALVYTSNEDDFVLDEEETIVFDQSIDDSEENSTARVEAI
jgi:hypothetical protein